MFEKRHVLTHNSGIIDMAYINHTGQSESLSGTRITVSESDVESFLNVLNIVVEESEKRFKQIETE